VVASGWSAIEHAAKLTGKEIDFQKLFLKQEEEEDEASISLVDALTVLAQTWPKGFHATDVAQLINNSFSLIWMLSLCASFCTRASRQAKWPPHGPSANAWRLMSMSRSRAAIAPSSSARWKKQPIGKRREL
jgi:hypothetical protein